MQRQPSLTLPAWRLAAFVLSLAVAAGAAQAADVYRGVLQCAEIPGYTSGPLRADLAVTVDGARASFDRDLRNRQTAAEIAVAEHATGTVAGNQVTLTSSVAQTYRHKEKNWQFDGTYKGPLAGNQLKLVGEQVWTTGTMLTPFHRACHAELMR